MLVPNHESAHAPSLAQVVHEPASALSDQHIRSVVQATEPLSDDIYTLTMNDASGTFAWSCLLYSGAEHAFPLTYRKQVN